MRVVIVAIDGDAPDLAFDEIHLPLVEEIVLLDDWEVAKLVRNAGFDEWWKPNDFWPLSTAVLDFLSAVKTAFEVDATAEVEMEAVMLSVSMSLTLDRLPDAEACTV